MIPAPVLQDELERLSDLHTLNLLGRPTEERFDRLTRLARRALDVEMCYLALVDGDRQWFKSKCGISRDSTSRRVSFCGHTIAGNEMLVVPDAWQDERFSDNPLVIGDPWVRFYAGMPLRGPGGHNIGTFCIADPQPRQMSPDQRDLLEEYACLAERELNLLDLVQAQGQLLETRSQLEVARRNLQRELGDAAEFVHQKLPPPFQSGCLGLDWAFIASSQLGGDMFGLERLPNGNYMVYLLDVSGHGIGASLLAVTIHNSLQQMASGENAIGAPSVALNRLNSTFQMRANQDRFFTIWCGLIDVEQHTITWASGGHPAPLLIDAKHRPLALDGGGLIVGVDPAVEYREYRVPYEPGSRLLLFSDGILEQASPEGQLFGRDRLEQLLLSGNSRPRPSHIISELSRWSATDSFADDISLVELSLKS